MGHRFADHTGEVELLTEAGSEAEIFAEVARAFAELVDRGSAGRPGRRHVALRAEDRAALLVDWVNELVYLAEVDGFVPGRAEIRIDGATLDASLTGRLDAAPANLVKAATLSGLEFEEGPDGWRARLVLDV